MTLWFLIVAKTERLCERMQDALLLKWRCRPCSWFTWSYLLFWKHTAQEFLSCKKEVWWSTKCMNHKWILVCRYTSCNMEYSLHA